MSHTVVRGQPTASQLYLDGILKEILDIKGLKDDVANRDKLTLAEIIFHCMKKIPEAICMINATTGEKFTNDYILQHAVSLARAMVAKGLRGKTVMLLMKDHEKAYAMYWAAIFAGSMPYLMDPYTTVYEIRIFVELIEPKYVFCDRELYQGVSDALEHSQWDSNLVVANEDRYLANFMDGFNDDYSCFEVAESTPESTVMLLPTSGSTGLPKAASLDNRGLVAQIAPTWAYHTQFPKPTELVMVLTTMQWMTFTMYATSCAVYHIPILMTPTKITVQHVLEILEEYRPTWTFFGPAFGKQLIQAARPDHLASLETVVLLGAPATPDVMAAFQAKLPKTTHLCDGYGTTETQGFIAIPDREAPVNANGRVLNILQYKVINDDGVEVEPGNNGELYVKGDSVIKSYHKNDASYKESFVDGWYRTGDWFYLDKNERLYYVERRKFCFKFLGCHVAPEEVEAVISTVPGVQESVVCGTDNGPAAAVVVDPKYTMHREHIHKAVDTTLSDHKRLRGGIAFIPTIPHTHTGKLHRGECKKLIHKLIETGECCF